MIRSEVLDLRERGRLDVHLLRRLDVAADSEYRAYNDLLASMSHGKERDIDWQVCRPATRNNHTSDLYKQCIQLALIRQLIDEGCHLTIIVDSAEMSEVLLSVNEPKIKVVRAARLSSWVGKLKGYVRDIAGSLFHILSAAVASRLSRGAARPLPSQPLTILNTFFMPDSLANGQFGNPDYPGLLESLTPQERTCCYFLPTFYRQRRYVSTFRALRSADANFIFREDYLTLADYFFAFGHWLRAGRLKNVRAQFAGFEIGALVDADIQGGRFSFTALTALLAHRFLRATANRGIRIRYILDWYEGLDINRGTAAAVNWYRPDIDLVGFRSAGSFFYTSATPAAYEAVLQVMPKTIAAVGLQNAAAMQALCPTAKFIPGPGFRYRKIATLQRVPPEDRGILVALPMFKDLACEALTTLIAALSLKDRKATHWWLKCHPGLPPEEIKAAFGNALPDEFVFVEGSFYDCLVSASVVVSTGSGTLIEAVALGIPTICLTSGNVPTEIPVPSWVDDELHTVAYDAREVADALDKFQQTNPTVDVAALQAGLLSPATPSAVRQLLKLDRMFDPLPVLHRARRF